MYLKKLFGDFFGLINVCGPKVALKWLGQVFFRLPEVLKKKNLQPADRGMGMGPFQVKYALAGSSFTVIGEEAFSGIREMYVRDTYLHGGVLTISEEDTVVDLGANMGNFTNLALAHGAGVNVIAVEPNANSNSVFEESVGSNPGYLDRVKLIRAFVGLMAGKQQSLSQDSAYSDAPWLSEDELIQRAGVEKIDFLKCDIEGGEFDLLTPQSRLLAMTRLIAVEIHHFAGDVDAFIKMLRSCSFTILNIQRDPDGTATVLAKRS